MKSQEELKNKFIVFVRNPNFALFGFIPRFLYRIIFFGIWSLYLKFDTSYTGIEVV